MRLVSILAGLWLGLGVLPAAAQPAVDGTFVAETACPALQSIRRGENPGDVRLKVGEGYRLIARNRVPGTHYWLVVPGARPERRWVEMRCGTRAGGDMAAVVPSAGAEAAAATSSEPGRAATPGAAPEQKSAAAPARTAAASRNNRLAISWQSSFCERNAEKPECRTQTDDRPDARRFSLHGLWPQPRGREYCGVADAMVQVDKAGRWRQLPAPEVSAATRARLDGLMPGSQSALDRHEWLRHGSCYGPAEAYFSHSLDMVDAINASPVGKLFASRLGREVTVEEILAAFDAGFGAGAGRRVRVSCDRDGGRMIIGELTVELSGEVAGTPDLGRLMRAAKTVRPGCASGIVDRVGRQ